MAKRIALSHCLGIGLGSGAGTWWTGLSWYWAIELGAIGKAWDGEYRFAFEKASTPFVFLFAGILTSWVLARAWSTSAWWRQLIPGLAAGTVGAAIWWQGFVVHADFIGWASPSIQMFYMSYPTSILVVITALPSIVAAWLVLKTGVLSNR